MTEAAPTRRRPVLGSRGSALALAQARWVEARIREQDPDLAPEILVIKTEGDRSQSISLTAGASVGIFVREIEEQLRSGAIDLAVHSLKDLPTAQPPELVVAAIPIREDPSDVLVVRDGRGLGDLPERARVGTGSPRRMGQLLHVRPDLRFQPIRGNVDTRLRKLQQGEVDALILAAAGLNRLAAAGFRFHPLSFDLILPAPGQGALGIEVRRADTDLAAALIRILDHPESATAVRAERAFLRALGGGCQLPVGALGTVKGSALALRGAVAARDGSKVLRDEVHGSASRADETGEELGRRMLQAGAGALLGGEAPPAGTA